MPPEVTATARAGVFLRGLGPGVNSKGPTPHLKEAPWYPEEFVQPSLVYQTFTECLCSPGPPSWALGDFGEQGRAHPKTRPQGEAREGGTGVTLSPDGSSLVHKVPEKPVALGFPSLPSRHMPSPHPGLLGEIPQTGSDKK